MANEEHLRILRKGVDRWNDWRVENFEVEPDLSNISFVEEIALEKLRTSFFLASRITLLFLSLLFAALNGQKFVSNFLSSLTAQIALGFNISWILITLFALVSALLRGFIAGFIGKFITMSLFKFFSLDTTSLDLRYIDLSHANLKNSDLSGVNISRGNLIQADLSGANLSRLRASDTILEQAVLTGACIEGWDINSSTKLSGIVCQYIYKKNNQQERRPSDPIKNFASGEFVKLIQKSAETVDLIFNNGIDWKAFAISLEDLRVQYGEQDLSIQAIENKNNAFVIRLNVPPDADKGAIERQAKEFYETRLAVLEAQYEAKLEAKGEVLASYREQVEYERKRSTRLEGMVEKMAEQSPSSEIYNNHIYGNPANFANKLEDNARQQAKQYNYTAEQKQTLAEAAADIQQLLEQLSQTYPTTTQAEKLAVAAKAAEEIEANPALRSRVIGALKAGGIEALKELVDHPLVSILLAALEGWQQPESK